MIVFIVNVVEEGKETTNCWPLILLIDGGYIRRFYIDVERKKELLRFCILHPLNGKARLFLILVEYWHYRTNNNKIWPIDKGLIK